MAVSVCFTSHDSFYDEHCHDKYHDDHKHDNYKLDNDTTTATSGGLAPVCVKPWCSRPDIGLQYVRILLCVMPFHCFHTRLTAALKAVASHVCIRSPRAGSVVVGVGTVVLPLLCDADKTGSIVSRKQTSVGHKTTHTTTQRVYAWHVLVHCAS